MTRPALLVVGYGRIGHRIRRRAVAERWSGAVGSAHRWLGRGVGHFDRVANVVIDRSDLELYGNGARVSLRLQPRNPHFNSRHSHDGDDARAAQRVWLCHLQSLRVVTNRATKGGTVVDYTRGGDRFLQVMICKVFQDSHVNLVEIL